jgi:hypothetical protein
MSGGHASPRSIALAGSGLVACGAAIGLAAAVPVALGLGGVEPPLASELAAGIAFVLVLALAVIRLDAAVAVGLALSGVVLVEPAPTDVVLGVALLVAALSGRYRARAPGAVAGGLGALLALGLLSAVEVVDVDRAVVFFAITAYLVVLALWLSGYVSSLARARLVAACYLVAAVVSASLGALALVLAIPGRDLLVAGGRVHGLFQDPNVFGPFLVPIALVLVEDLLSPRLFRLGRAVKTGLALVLVLGVVLSFSRGAWVNLAVGLGVLLLVLALRRGGGRTALRALLLTLVLAVGIAAVLAATGSQEFLLERARFQSYDASRFAAHVVGIESAERYPFGVGPGQFESYAPISAHSTYIRVVGEQGMGGLAALAAVFFTTLVLAVANALAGRETYGIGSAALLGAWCGILVNSAVVDTLHWRHLWIVAALVWAGWARRRTGLRPRLAPAVAEATVPRSAGGPPGARRW